MTYQTADITLAAFLLANGCDLVQVHKENPRHIRFEFQNGEGLDNLVASYATGAAEVNALVFAEKLAEVKSLLWRAKKQDKTGEKER